MRTQIFPKKIPWLRWLIIILLGNAIYFYLSPWLPPAARHTRFKLDWGTLVDFWFCLIVFGIFELITYLRNRKKNSPQTKERL